MSHVKSDCWAINHPKPVCKITSGAELPTGATYADQLTKFTIDPTAKALWAVRDHDHHFTDVVNNHLTRKEAITAVRENTDELKVPGSFGGIPETCEPYPQILVSIASTKEGHTEN